MAPRLPSKSANMKRYTQSDTVESKKAPKKVYDSDDLDEDSDDQSKKRKRASPKKPQSPRKKARRRDENEELPEGQEIVGVVVQAPKTGRVPPGQISQNTLDFLTNLKDPACNDREWYLFSSHSVSLKF